jgi:hypothetical protein
LVFISSVEVAMVVLLAVESIVIVKAVDQIRLRSDP